MIKQKSEAFEKFKVFINLVENQTGHKVKRFRCDNAKEYVSNDFINFCKKRGIQREPTIPYIPQHNGVAERVNHTPMEMARSMLYHSGMPLSFWAEATSTAMYVQNRSPTLQLMVQQKTRR